MQGKQGSGFKVQGSEVPFFALRATTPHAGFRGLGFRGSGFRGSGFRGSRLRLKGFDAASRVHSLVNPTRLNMNLCTLTNAIYKW
jgi:hypothetical protein